MNGLSSGEELTQLGHRGTPIPMVRRDPDAGPTGLIGRDAAVGGAGSPPTGRTGGSARTGKDVEGELIAADAEADDDAAGGG